MNPKFGSDFAASFDAGKSPEEIRTFFKKIGDECACVSHREQSESPSYIHLKDARFFNAQGHPVHGDGGVWWRGRISEVQGFFPGDHFKPVPSSSFRENRSVKAENRVAESQYFSLDGGALLVP